MLGFNCSHRGATLKDDQTGDCLISKNALGSVKDDSGQPWRETDIGLRRKKKKHRFKQKVKSYTTGGVQWSGSDVLSSFLWSSVQFSHGCIVLGLYCVCFPDQTLLQSWYSNKWKNLHPWWDCTRALHRSKLNANCSALFFCRCSVYSVLCW